MGCRLMFLLDRIRSNTGGDLQVIEMDGVVRPIEAFGVVVRWNRRPEVLRRREVRRRGFLGISKPMMVWMDLRKADRWIWDLPRVAFVVVLLLGGVRCVVLKRGVGKPS